MEPRQLEVMQDNGTIDTLTHLNWNPRQLPGVDDAITSTNWHKLCLVASALRNSTPCRFLEKTNAGGNNLIRVLEFDDATRWIARIPLHRGKRHRHEQDSAALLSEVHTMQLIQERGGLHLRVPRIFVYEADAHNDVGVPFVLMEFLPTSTAMDANGGHSVHGGTIPKQLRPNLYRSVAQAHVQLTKLRFSKIGTIIRSAEKGEFDIGPLPYIGGPFETASAFFAAWAGRVKFRSDRAEIIRMMPADQPQLAQQIADAIESFPGRVRELFARRPPPCDSGPFPLAHTDFLHSNMLVDADFRLAALIDWEGAQTVPWECVLFPGFLSCMPPAFDLPTSYDESTGQPLDEQTQELWEERRQYVEMVKAAECDSDSLLSATLGDHRTQALAYALNAYEDIGKLGYYDRVISLFSNPSGC